MTVKDFLIHYYGKFIVYCFADNSPCSTDLIGPLNHDFGNPAHIPDNISDLTIRTIIPAEFFKGVQICVETPSWLSVQKEAI